jgi:RND superfamily putative drug exporter
VSPFLYSLGRWAARRRGIVLTAWLLLVALLASSALLLNQGIDNTIEIPATESQVALDRLTATFPQASGTSARILVITAEGEEVTALDIEEAVAEAITELEAVDEVLGVTDPFAESSSATLLSKDGRAALVTVQLEGVTSQSVSPQAKDRIKQIGAELTDALPDGSRAVVGGDLFNSEGNLLGGSEFVGLAVALVVLILTFGSLLVAGIPILSAVAGVAVTMSVLFLATNVTAVSSTTPVLALMLGLAVGIDYALFIVSRHREWVAGGVSPVEAAGRATATAGSAVIFAGLTVIIALTGLSIANIPFLTTMALAAAGGVAAAVVVALTLIPALLGFIGARVLPRRARVRVGSSASTGSDTDITDTPRTSPSAVAQPPSRFFASWVRGVTRHPIMAGVLVVAALGALTVPAAGLRLGLPDAGTLPEDNPTRVTYDLISEHFGPGFNGPLVVTGSIITSIDPIGLMDNLANEMRAFPGVALVPLATPNATADTGIIQVIPVNGPTSEETSQLVAAIRADKDRLLDEYGVELSVTGFTAVGIDASDRLEDALVPFGIIVVGLSLILLMMVFRSLWVPFTASLGYLLSIGAAFGAVTLVFEHGWFADVIQLPATGPVASFMPLLLMGVLFGLAMDYQVFLVSRMREDHVHGAEARAAIRSGFGGSAKVVTTAAIIMLAVFAAFVPGGNASIKSIGVGLAVGVFADAFLVRMVLIPAVMQLLGERVWRLPTWLDRLLPSLDVEGDGLRRELALADWPYPRSTAVIAAEDLTVADADDVVFTNLTLQAQPGVPIIVTGTDPRALTGVLLTLTGRMRPTSGRVKTLNLVLPERASAVRARTGYIDLSATASPAQALRVALAEQPEILAVDRADRIDDPGEAEAVRVLLTDAAQQGSTQRDTTRRGRGVLTVIVSHLHTTTDILLSNTPHPLTVTVTAPPPGRDGPVHDDAQHDGAAENTAVVGVSLEDLLEELS